MKFHFERLFQKIILIRKYETSYIGIIYQVKHAFKIKHTRSSLKALLKLT